MRLATYAAVFSCWLVPAYLVSMPHLTLEKLVFNFIGPLFLTVPALTIRIVVHTLRTLGLKPRLPSKDLMPLTEQLLSNWDSRSAGYRAGVGVYASVWTRDSFFGLFAPIAERGLRLRAFCDRLRDHATTVSGPGPCGYDTPGPTAPTYGHVPFQFNEVWYIPSMLLGRAFMRSKPVVLYCDDKYGQPVMDVNAQYVIMVAEAYALSNDRHWLATHAEAIGQMIAFYELYADEKGRVHELPFGNWEDSLLFEGARAFTNLLYLEALRRARDLFLALGRTAEAKKFDNTFKRVYEPVLDLVSTQRDTESVALAGLWLQGEKRVEVWMQEMLAVYPDTMPPNRWPVPPPSTCCTTMRIIGQAGYHRDFRWSNVGCLWAAALLQRGFREAGEQVLARFDSVVERFGTVHEVYDPEDDNPVSYALYHSETHFSMGLGPYLLAKEIQAGLSKPHKKRTQRSPAKGR